MACTAISVVVLVILVILDARLCASSHAQPPVTELLSSNNAADIRSRLRRKAPLADTSRPVAYMMQLRDSLADADGRPRTASDDPTNVWCLLDKDLLDDIHRPKPSNKKCKVVHRFRFSMKALQQTFQHDIHLQKGLLRVYVNVIERYLKQQPSIETQITNTFTLTQSSSNTTVTVLGGQEDMIITMDSKGWVELNVTSGLLDIQTLSPEIADTFDLMVTISVNCRENRKVPMTLADPAAVPLSQGPRRRRLTNYQPMLLVYLSDEHLKTEIQQEAEPPTVGENLSMDGTEKRSVTGCHLEDFQVNFQNIELTYVLAPFEYNARKCVGSCAHSVLRYQGNLATNHAKIMASAVAFQDYDPQTPFHHQPTEPCCVPTKYESMSLLIFIDNELNYGVYPTMVVSACGCR